MTQGIHPLAAAMVNQLNRVEVVSNNLANANTTGFKQENISEGSFNHYLNRMKEDGVEPAQLSEIMNTIPKYDDKYINSSLGSIKDTGNRLDFAISDKETFFKVQNENGDIELTRDGSFKILDNTLVTQNGYKVLDKNNNPITVSQENDDFVNTISLVTTSYENIEKIGNNNYKFLSKENLKENDNSEVMIRGSLETSNVSSIASMVDLIEAQRKFEQAQKAITGINDIDKKVIDTIGNNR